MRGALKLVSSRSLKRLKKRRSENHNTNTGHDKRKRARRYIKEPKRIP